jgi:hypothetical protein
VEGRHLVAQGEAIQVLRFNATDEAGFAWVRSRSQPQKQGNVGDVEHHFLSLICQALTRIDERFISGFLRSDYISYTAEHKSGR